MKGTHFESISDIQTNVTEVIKAIPQKDFQKSYDEWKIRWAKCIRSEGNYFEGDPIVIE